MSWILGVMDWKVMLEYSTWGAKKQGITRDGGPWEVQGESLAHWTRLQTMNLFRDRYGYVRSDGSIYVPMYVYRAPDADLLLK